MRDHLFILRKCSFLQNEELHRGEREGRSSYICYGQENEPLGGKGQMCRDVAPFYHHQDLLIYQQN